MFTNFRKQQPDGGAVQVWRAGRSGQTLISVCIVTLMLTSLAAFAYNASIDASRSSKLRENYEQAKAAAEYGAETAIGALIGLERGVADPKTITNDWVGKKLYVDKDDHISPDARRIGGRWGEQDFRVQVRSVGRAYAHGDSEPGYIATGWLRRPEGFTVPSATAPADILKFEDVYEITATARNHLVSTGKASPELHPEATVRGIVNLESDSESMSLLASPLNSDSTLSSMAGVSISAEDHSLATQVTRSVAKKTGATQIATSKANYFGARGSYWSSGYLTLNYQVDDNVDYGSVNPLRPWTSGFSAVYPKFPADSTKKLADSETARAMRKRWDLENANYKYTGNQNTRARPTSINQTALKANHETYAFDTYLLGGKAGKTVTTASKIEELVIANQKLTAADATGYNFAKLPGGVLIKEVQNDQTDAGSFFNVVLSSFEDLSRLYINMTASGLASPSTWWQHYFGEYTLKSKGQTIDGTTFPTESSERIRCKTLHIVLNKSEEMLVKEFAAKKDMADVNSGKKTLSAIATVNYTNSTYNTWTGRYTWAPYAMKSTTGFTLKTDTAKTIVPRMFQWQELLGYKLAKRTGDTYESYVTTGSKTYTATDASRPPALRINAASTLTYNFNDKSLKVNDGTQRSYPQYDVAGMTQPTGFDEEYQKGASLYPTDRNDTFELYFPANYHGDGKAAGFTTITSMDDLLFENNFGTSADPNKLQAVAIFIMYEDLAESGADFNYSDLMFTVWVAPEMDGGGVTITSNNKSWWEQDPEDGLTGEEAATTAISTSASGFDSTAGEVIGNNNDIATGTNFNKAQFQTNDVGGSGADMRGVLVAGTESGDYYYDNIDLDNIMQRNLEDYLPGSPGLSVKWDLDADGNIGAAEATLFKEAQLAKAAEVMRTLNTMAWETPRPSQDAATDAWLLWRKDVMAKGTVRLLHISERPTSDVDTTSLISQREAKLTIRKFVADYFGGATISVPTVRTNAEGTMRVNNDGVPTTPFAAPTSKNAGFLPTEFNNVGDIATGLQPGTPNSVAFEDRDYGDQADGLPLTPKIYSTVAECYAKFVFPANYITAKTNDELWAEMKNKYGTKEERYSIGFHRAGSATMLDTDPAVANLKASLLLDHYENILLAQVGHNPFITITEDGKEFIALRQKVESVDGSGVTHYSYLASLKPVRDSAGNPVAQLWPQFVFPDPIDGAGTMVVYGDLLVEDVFAYDGKLIVLGDIYVNPTLKERPKYGEDGNYVDSEGHSLKVDEAGKYYYLNENDVRVYKDESGKDLTPVMENTVKGALIAQGAVLVSGDVHLNSTLDANGNVVKGEMTVLKKDTDSPSDKEPSFTLKRIQWLIDPNFSAENLWNDTLE